MRKFVFLALAIISILSLLLAGCGSSSTSTTSTTTTSAAPGSTTSSSTTSTSTTAAPKYGGTLRIAESLIPGNNLGWVGDPAWLIQPAATCMFLDSFMNVDVNNNITPALVTKWDVAPDLSSITFTLRQGVKFHDGSTWNADVAKWNIDQLVASKVSVYTQVSSVEVVDDYTIKINVSHYTNILLSTIGETFVVSKAAYDSHGANKDAIDWMRFHPVGTGPFVFESFTPQVSVKGTRFDDYWGGKPYLDAIDMEYVADPVTRAQALQAGEFDVIAGNLSKTEADLKATGQYKVDYFPIAISSLVPDSANPASPLSNEEVRKAIDYAIDRNAIVSALGYGWTVATYQYAIPGTPAYINNLDARTYNLDKAKQMLADAGYPNGFAINILGSTATTNKDVMTAVQGMLAKIGITVTLNMIDHPSYNQAIKTGWDGFAAASKLIDANMNFAILTNWVDKNVNPSLEKPQELVDLYNAAAGTKDYDPALTQKVIQYMYDHATILCLYGDPRGDIMQPYVMDAGYFAQARALNWSPAKTWLNK